MADETGYSETIPYMVVDDQEGKSKSHISEFPKTSTEHGHDDGKSTDSLNGIKKLTTEVLTFTANMKTDINQENDEDEENEENQENEEILTEKDPSNKTSGEISHSSEEDKSGSSSSDEENNRLSDAQIPDMTRQKDLEENKISSSSDEDEYPLTDEKMTMTVELVETSTIVPEDHENESEKQSLPLLEKDLSNSSSDEEGTPPLDTEEDDNTEDANAITLGNKTADIVDQIDETEVAESSISDTETSPIFEQKNLNVAEGETDDEGDPSSDEDDNNSSHHVDTKIETEAETTAVDGGEESVNAVTSKDHSKGQTRSSSDDECESKIKANVNLMAVGVKTASTKDYSDDDSDSLHEDKSSLLPDREVDDPEIEEMKTKDCMENEYDSSDGGNDPSPDATADTTFETTTLNLLEDHENDQSDFTSNKKINISFDLNIDEKVEVKRPTKIKPEEHAERDSSTDEENSGSSAPNVTLEMKTCQSIVKTADPKEDKSDSSSDGEDSKICETVDVKMKREDDPRKIIIENEDRCSSELTQDSMSGVKVKVKSEGEPHTNIKIDESKNERSDSQTDAPRHYIASNIVVQVGEKERIEASTKPDHEDDSSSQEHVQDEHEFTEQDDEDGFLRRRPKPVYMGTELQTLHSKGIGDAKENFGTEEESSFISSPTPQNYSTEINQKLGTKSDITLRKEEEAPEADRSFNETSHHQHDNEKNELPKAVFQSSELEEEKGEEDEEVEIQQVALEVHRKIDNVIDILNQYDEANTESITADKKDLCEVDQNQTVVCAESSSLLIEYLQQETKSDTDEDSKNQNDNAMELHEVRETDEKRREKRLEVTEVSIDHMKGEKLNDDNVIVESSTKRNKTLVIVEEPATENKVLQSEHAISFDALENQHTECTGSKENLSQVADSLTDAETASKDINETSDVAHSKKDEQCDEQVKDEQCDEQVKDEQWDDQNVAKETITSRGTVSVIEEVDTTQTQPERRIELAIYSFKENSQASKYHGINEWTLVNFSNAEIELFLSLKRKMTDDEELNEPDSSTSHKTCTIL